MHNNLAGKRSDVDGFLRLPEVLVLIPVSRSGWWAGIRAGRYPRGVKLGPRTTAWRASASADVKCPLIAGLICPPTCATGTRPCGQATERTETLKRGDFLMTAGPLVGGLVILPQRRAGPTRTFEFGPDSLEVG